MLRGATSVSFTLCLLLFPLLPVGAGATVIALHEGSGDPVTEGWELAIAGDSGASGGSETTASGEHAFWHVRDSAEDGGIAYGFAIDAGDLSGDWRLEAIVRVVDAPTCPGCTDFGDVGVIVRDGLNYWSFYLGNSNAGPISDTGKAGPHSLLLSHPLDTRADYHRYEIQFSQNGAGPEDDSADFSVDGALVFDDVGRTGLWTANEVLVGFGAVSTFGVGEARWQLVRFDDGRVPEASTAVLLAGALGMLALSRCHSGFRPCARGRASSISCSASASIIRWVSAPKITL